MSRSPTRRAARPRKTRPARVGLADPAVALVVVPLGRAVLLEYADEKGRRKVHAFKRGAPLFATRKGDKLIIAGVRVKDKEVHDVT